jgi:DNA-binding transcriptional MerR regulator
VSTWTVGEVAALAGVSVRTLHHYDALGLVVPSSRSRSGYRRYSGSDLERLQEVLVYKQLGFGLDEIAGLLDDPGHDRRAALLRQRDLLAQQAERLAAVRALVDRTLASLDGGTTMSGTDMFDGLDPVEWNERTHGAEVRERWGDTDAYRESVRRTSQYGPDDWARMQAQTEAIEAGLAALLAEGVPAEDPRAMDLAEQHRLQIDHWFYPCSHEMHAGLGDMYVADERFTAHYDGRATGLAAYVRDAILANALRATP